MAANLEPRLDALESSLERGALVRIDRSVASHQATATVGLNSATVTGNSSAGQLALQQDPQAELVARYRRKLSMALN